MADDNIQHGIDDDPKNDAEKGAALGGLGGAIVGAVAGSAIGPIGTVIGAVVGGLGGAGASGLAVGAVDKADNDDTVTGVGGGATTDVNAAASDAAVTTPSHSMSGSGSLSSAMGSEATRPVMSSASAGRGDDTVQHGIDDDPNNDAEKGAKLGGLGGAVVGAGAGMVAGPVGAVVGAAVGGLAGAGASGLAVGAVDKVDNDNTVSGVGQGATRDVNDTVADVSGADIRNASTGVTSQGAIDSNADMPGMAGSNATPGVRADITPGNNVPGIQTGGTTAAGTPDTRGITEKAADAVTSDRTDDKTGQTV